jgi:PAS domain S-box-containing protein
MDIRTLATILGITHLVQVVVFSLQASINKTYRGIGWWLLWSATEVVGFMFVLLRAIPAIHRVSIIAQNSLILLGAIFLYVGIMRFLDKEEKRGIVMSIFVAFSFVHGYFTFVKDDIFVRTVAICAALAAVSFVSAQGLFVNRIHSIKASANFITAVFLAHGVYFVIRTAAIVSGIPIHDMFSTSLINVSAYLDGIIVSIMWTCGLILMVSQRANAEMAQTKQHFESIFNTSPDAAVISRLGDGKILDVNHAFSDLTGFSREEAIGKSSIEARIWKDLADRKRIVSELLENGASENFEAEFLRRDGSVLTGLMSAKIINLLGEDHMISVTRDISGRKRAEEKISLLLTEKEILLKEVHHRIKNNMSSLMGILTLQSVNTKNPETNAALVDLKNRLQSMGVLYDKLYRSANVSQMSIRAYLPPLIDEIIAIFPIRTRIRVEKKVDDFIVGVDVLSPLGIIVNELLTNSLKYAFTGREEGLITIAACKEGQHVSVTIQDNGIGIPESENIDHSSGMGLQLVGMLMKQIRGKVTVERDRGTKYFLEFDA